MKLKKLLKHIEFLQKVQILIYDNDDTLQKISHEEILYEGLADNVPWCYAEMYLDTDSNGEAIGSFIKDNETIITIFIKEGK